MNDRATTCPLEAHYLAAVGDARRAELLALLRLGEEDFYRRLARVYGAEVGWLLSAAERSRWRVEGEPVALLSDALARPLAEAARLWANPGAVPDCEPPVPEEESHPALDPPLRGLLVMRFGLRAAEFARRLFPHHTRLAFSPLHRWLFERRDALAAPFCPGRLGRRLAVAAPRGAAKSTLISLLFPLHDLLYLRERYILLVSATLRQAERRLELIRGELRANPVLARLFPEALQRGAKDRIDNARTIRLRGVRLDAASALTELRGLTDGPWRPTAVILDDAEPNEVAFSPLRREKLLEWYRDVIEPIGDRYTNVTAAGTLLHPESLLARLAATPEFEGRTFRSVVRWSPRQDLWTEWARHYADAADPEREARAERFFRARRAAMLEGTEVLWPEKEDYLALMQQLARMGRRAFLKEKQNEPRRREGMLFDPDTFRWLTLAGGTIRLDPPPAAGRFGLSREESDLASFLPPGDEPEGGAAPADAGDSSGVREVPLAQLTTVGFLDAATGAAPSGDGDDAAIAVVGRDRSGQFYLLDVWMEPALPTRQAAQVFDLHERWRFVRFGLESNCFQSLLRLPLEAERRRRAASGRPEARLPFQQVHQSRAKAQRIAALEPALTQGWLAVSRDVPERFLSQAEQYPHARHDDGLDAVAAALELARSMEGAKAGTVQRSRRRTARGW